MKLSTPTVQEYLPPGVMIVQRYGGYIQVKLKEEGGQISATLGNGVKVDLSTREERTARLVLGEEIRVKI